jgi:hypothetical protein
MRWELSGSKEISSIGRKLLQIRHRKEEFTKERYSSRMGLYRFFNAID